MLDRWGDTVKLHPPETMGAFVLSKEINLSGGLFYAVLTYEKAPPEEAQWKLRSSTGEFPCVM